MTRTRIYLTAAVAAVAAILAALGMTEEAGRLLDLLTME